MLSALFTSCLAGILARPASRRPSVSMATRRRMAALGGSHEAPVDVLILGAGWTASFLIPHIEKYTRFTYCSTTRSGGGEFDSIKFEFDPSGPEENSNQFKSLPFANNILITFPIKDDGASQLLLENYARAHSARKATINVIQLGSTGMFDHSAAAHGNLDGIKKHSVFLDRHSPFNPQDPRGRSETELLSLNGSDRFDNIKYLTTVLNLSGLWGNERHIQNYVSKVLPTKEALSTKTSIHMIHGLDVARAILAVIEKFDLSSGQRWILTDLRVYDWWDLASAWGESGQKNRQTEVTIGCQAQWVHELMREQSVQVLPRSPLQLGRVLDSLEFWSTFQLSPVRARLENPS